VEPPGKPALHELGQDLLIRQIRQPHPVEVIVLHELIEHVGTEHHRPGHGDRHTGVFVEQAVLYAAERLSMTEYERRTNFKLMRELPRRGVLPENTLKLYDQLRELRNEAAHASDFAISASEAERYSEIAIELAEMIHSRVDAELSNGNAADNKD